MGVLRKIFKTYSEKEVKRVMPIVQKINDLEPEMAKLSDKELTEKTAYFKKQLEEGKTLDDILPEAFAVVREASKKYILPKKDNSDIIINGASSLEYFTQIIDYIYQITNNFSNPEQ